MNLYFTKALLLAMGALAASTEARALRARRLQDYFFIRGGIGCLEPKNGCVETGELLILGDCSDDLNTWRQEEDGNGAVRFHARRDDLQCLQATLAGSLEDGAHMRIYPCGDSDLQLFVWSDDYLKPMSRPDLCVVYQGTSADINEDRIIMKDCDTVMEQEAQGIEKRWSYGGAESSEDPPPENDPPMAPPENDPPIFCSDASDCPDGRFCQGGTCIRAGNPRFTLEWTGDDDLDLHVITPGGFEIFFDATSDPISNGFLDVDIIPSLQVPSSGDWVENVVFPIDGSAPTGVYQFFVVNFDQIGADADSWTLTVFEGDTQVRMETGTTVGTSSESARFTITV